MLSLLWWGPRLEICDRIFKFQTENGSNLGKRQQDKPANPMHYLSNRSAINWFQMHSLFSRWLFEADPLDVFCCFLVRLFTHNGCSSGRGISNSFTTSTIALQTLDQILKGSRGVWFGWSGTIANRLQTPIQLIAIFHYRHKNYLAQTRAVLA